MHMGNVGKTLTQFIPVSQTEQAPGYVLVFRIHHRSFMASQTDATSTYMYQIPWNFVLTAKFRMLI